MIYKTGYRQINIVSQSKTATMNSYYVLSLICLTFCGISSCIEFTNKTQQIKELAKAQLSEDNPIFSIYSANETINGFCGGFFDGIEVSFKNPQNTALFSNFICTYRTN